MGAGAKVGAQKMGAGASKMTASVKQYAQKKIAERQGGATVPQETEESKDPRPVFVIDDEIGEESN